MENTDSIFSDIQNSETEASYFQRLLASLIDFAVEIFIVFSIYIIIPKEIILGLIGSNTYTSYFLIFFILFLYRFICIIIFQKTIGMMLCRLKYLNGDLEPLSIKQKLIAVFIPRTQSVKYYKIN
ncbi:RDD family protein [Lacibacter sediminis]|uniref:RDD family protein n=1 Tax=Lacibacter sediminis TaxID=2760713 RepID=A0A7G5XHH1_9BACT|nr:RDD family protein [Lacibacter sediminis]